MQSRGGDAMNWSSFIVELYRRLADDEVTALSAQLTYYLLLAFFPFLFFIITLLSYTPLASDILLNHLSQILPREAYLQVSNIINETVLARSQTLLSIGMLGTLWAASNGMNAIIHGINKAYFEKETRPFWKVRGISILFTLALTIVIMLSIALLVFGQQLGKALFMFLGASHLFAQFWTIFRYVIPLTAMLIVFMFFYIISPDRRVGIREVLPGTIFTSVGWIIISWMFSLYVDQFAHYTYIYGSLGGIIILLLWMYISSIILLTGGELNALIYANKHNTED
jgi:membrane protein